uniref:Cytochrome P450 n=2 Tax=Manihot esculenta TaxID=3983 RepID=A0A2C9W7B9_MANES
MSNLFIFKYKTEKLPPGPRKLPLVGNLHQLLGQVSTVIISSPDMAKEVMKTHDIIFAYRPNLLAGRIMSYDSTNIAFSPYGNYWRQLRKICMIELLSPNRVQSFRSIREDEVETLIKTISSSAGSPVNLGEKVFSMIYSITARAAFGEKCKDQEQFMSLILRSSALAGGFCLGDMYPSVKALQVISGMKPKLEKLHQEMDKILDNILKEHREEKLAAKTGDEEGREDLVDILLRFQEKGDLEFSLADNNIKAVILDILGGGSETSATTIEWAMSEMLRNPRVMKEAQAEVRRVLDGKVDMDEGSIQELKYLKLVIKETLRLHPPVPLLLPRECSETCEINGYKIPAKTRVIVNAWTLGRDPSYWSEAETFFPERFVDSSIDFKGTNFEYIPFGAGRRICPGISFAQPSIELPLAHLLYHFDWKLANGLKHEDLDMTETCGLTARRKQFLVLIPIPYK